MTDTLTYLDKRLSLSSAQEQLSRFLGITQRTFFEVMPDVFKIDSLKVPSFTLKYGTKAENRGEINLAEDSCYDFTVRLDISQGDVAYNCCSPCFDRWLFSRGSIFAHELGHLFHMAANPCYWNARAEEKFLWEVSESTWILGEMVAQVSNIFYHRQLGIYDRISDYETLVGDPLSVSSINISLAAQKFLDHNYHSFHDLASSLSFDRFDEYCDQYFTVPFKIDEQNFFKNCVSSSRRQYLQNRLF